MNKPNIKTVFAFFFASSICPAPYNFATTIAPPPASPSPREVRSILIWAIVATALTLESPISATMIWSTKV